MLLVIILAWEPEVIKICTFAAYAGFLSGFPGIESVPGPQLPQVDFLTRFNGNNISNKLHSFALEVT